MRNRATQLERDTDLAERRTISASFADARKGQAVCYCTQQIFFEGRYVGVGNPNLTSADFGFVACIETLLDPERKLPLPTMGGYRTAIERNAEDSWPSWFRRMHAADPEKLEQAL